MTVEDMQTDEQDDSKPAAAASPPSETTMQVEETTTAATAPIKRDSFNGVWILDKSKENWSMRGYLETLHVNELAIQAHEKGELEHDTFHTITVDAEATPNKIKIVKRSRVNNDLVVELVIGEEKVDHLQPGDRPKKSLATTEDSLKTHLQIQSSLLTMNGMAHVTDIKRLVPQPDGTLVLVQELTIINEQTKATKATTRYFNPFDGSMDLS